MEFKDFLFEELTEKQKKTVDSWGRTAYWIKKQHDKVFGEGNHKVVIPLESNTAPIHKGNVYESNNPRAMKISGHLVSHGYELTDYIKGFAKNTRGMRGPDGKIVDDPRDHKIGAILAKTGGDKITSHIRTKKGELTLSQAFASDPMRSQKTKEGLKAVISRHPYDVAGMSTDRGWSSCSDMDVGGPARKHLPADIHNGTLTAYLVHHDDEDIKNPIGRVNLKKHDVSLGQGESIWRPEGKYGTTTPEFHKAVNEWATKNYPESPKAHVYKKDPELYNDDGKSHHFPEHSEISKYFIPAFHEATAEHSKMEEGGVRHYEGHEVMKKFDNSLKDTNKNIPDKEKKHAADIFSSGKHHGVIEHGDLGSGYDQDAIDNYWHKYHEHPAHNDIPMSQFVKHDWNDYHKLIGNHVALDPVHFMNHASNPKAFAEALHTIHTNNSDGNHEENTGIHDGHVHEFMLKHLSSADKYEMGRQRTHETFGDNLNDIKDHDYLDGMADHYHEHGITSNWYHQQTENKDIQHILRHGHYSSVNKLLASPHIEFDEEDHQLAKNNLASQKEAAVHELKTAHPEKVRELLRTSPFDFSKEDHKAALDNMERHLKGKEKPGEQIWSRKHESVFNKMKAESKIQEFSEFLLNEAIANFKHDSVHYPKLSRSDAFTRLANKIQSKGYSKISSGLFSQVFKHPERDDHVIKLSWTATTNPDHDPYVNYIKKGNQGSFSTRNPHVPRVEQVKSIITKDGSVHLTKMEKLHPINELSDEERDALVRHATKGAEDAHSSIYGMTRYFRSLPPDSTSKEIQTAKNKAFGAMNQINKQDINRNVNTDVHEGNIMARRTPYGPQLVLTDPLASGQDVHKALGF